MKDNSQQSNQQGDLVDDLTRWEDDGGQNMGEDYAWLPVSASTIQPRTQAGNDRPGEIKSTVGVTQENKARD